MPRLIGTYHNGDCLAVIANQKILAIRTMRLREHASTWRMLNFAWIEPGLRLAARERRRDRHGR